MFKLLKIVPFLALLSALPVACQTDYKAAAENALTVLQKWYSKDHGTWDGTGFWNSANCLTVIADLALIDADIRSTGDPVFINTLSAAQGQGKKVKKRALSSGGFESEDFTPAKAGRYEKRGNKNFLDSFYDDEGWWALAWMKVFDVTQNTQYLDAAVTIYQDMKGGWPTKCNNGGIWWDKKKTYANAIANELFLSVASHLANRVSPDQKQAYVTDAQAAWTWFKASGLINSENLINDGLDKDTCQNNGANVWSYNQGVILGALVELNKAAPDPALLTTANTLAGAAVPHLSDANGVIHDGCDGNDSCGKDGDQFKGIFIRNLAELNAVSPSDAYAQAVTKSADSILANDHNGDGQFGVNWSGPSTGENAATHSSAMDAVVAAFGLQH